MKKKYTIIKILILMLIIISANITYSQNLAIIENNGNGATCVGEVKTYRLINTQINVTYSWIISPGGQNTLSPVQLYQQQIQWLNEGNFQIIVNGSNGTSATLPITVYKALNPFITTSNEVGCEVILKQKDQYGNIILDDPNSCINVCENSIVEYFANSQAPQTSNFQSIYSWSVTGGVFYPSNATTLTGTSTTPLADVKVRWGGTGAGNITVTERCNIDCTPKSKTICVEKIPSPKAIFSFDGLSEHDLPYNECYKICTNHEVNFNDLSTESSNSPILYWEWDFGDGSPISPLRLPSHVYTTPGEYYVILKITNHCNCSSVFKRQICVSEAQSPQIVCPSVVCENSTAIYSTNTNCNEYIWEIIGGEMQPLLPNQSNNEVAVIWNQVDDEGFGYVKLSGEPCEGKCPSWAVVRVPVIKANGTIKGQTAVCPNSYYRYKLPAWPATNYTWRIINNTTGTIINSHTDNSNEIEILTDNTHGEFRIECDYVNTIVDCSGYAYIDVRLRQQPVIVAPEEICLNSPLTCSLSNVPTLNGNTIWRITKPNGTIVTQSTPPSLNSITFASTIFAAIGNYIIRAINTASFCEPDVVVVEVKNPPAAPNNIIGEDNVCLHFPYTYTVDVMPNTNVNWTIVGGVVSGTLNQTTAIGNTISVKWNTTGTKQIKATRSWANLPNCNSTAFVKPINHIVVNGNIVKNPIGDTVCEDSKEIFSMELLPLIEAEAYLWSITPSAAGSITTGQGTNMCEVTFNHSGAPSQCLIKCRVTKCGQDYIFTKTIYIETSTKITTLTASNTTICSGVPVTFTAQTTGAPAISFIWNFGNGNTQTTSTGTVTTNVNTFTNISNGNQTFTVSVQAVSQCNNTLSNVVFIPIIVKPQPVASISPAGTYYFCPNETINMNTTLSMPANCTYQWYNNTTPISSGFTYNATTFGNYYAIVTNAEGCQTKTYSLNILEDDCTTPPPCDPVLPAGIENFVTTLMSCGKVKATCNTLGTFPSPPGNIVSYEWKFKNYGADYTLGSTSQGINFSPEYIVSKPGLYQIALEVQYQNLITGGQPCIMKSAANVLVPLIADFNWGMVCDGNNGYKLSLFDNSLVYANMNVWSREWKINGITISTLQNPPDIQMTNYLGQTINVELIVKNGDNNICNITKSIQIPTLPVANFNITTTNLTTPITTATRSCEGRVVYFNNISTPMNFNVFNVWNFGDNTSLHGLHAGKEYVYDNQFSQNNERTITLTITDKYGCTSSLQKTINIDNNNLSASGTEPTDYYTTTPNTSPCFPLPVTVNVNIGGGFPTYFQWYKETEQVNLLNSSGVAHTNYVQVYNEGAYWTQLRDNNYCIKNINPSPAIVSFRYPVQAVISGKQDVCDGESYKLIAPPGSDLTYSWTCNGVSCGTTQTITETKAPGIYWYVLTVTQTGVGGCNSTSSPYMVTVHDLPAPPIASYSMVDCNNYTIELSAYSNLNSNFTWSNGKKGSPVYTTHGGPYRVWQTDEYGCKSHADLDIPLAPSAYFWRFPTGCYSFCNDELPKQVDPPSYINFNYWEWDINGSAVNPNNGWGGYGANSVCAPLWLHLDWGGGSGSGDYSWILDNGLCSQTSGIMSVDIKKECCKINVKEANIYCGDANYYNLDLEIDNPNPYCENAFCNISILDPNTMQTIANVNYINILPLNMGNIVVLGNNSITATFPFAPNLLPYFNNNVFIKIETICNFSESCFGYFKTKLPSCDFGSKKVITEISENTENYKPELNILPNPAKTEAKIFYQFANDKFSDNRNIKIHDIMGRPINEIKLENSKGVYNWNVSNYSPGIYFVELHENNNRIITKRIVINH